MKKLNSNAIEQLPCQNIRIYLNKYNLLLLMKIINQNPV